MSNTNETTALTAKLLDLGKGADQSDGRYVAILPDGRAARADSFEQALEALSAQLGCPVVGGEIERR